MPTETENLFLQKVLQIIALRRLSLDVISQKTGIKKPALTRFLKNQDGLTWDKLEKLCHLLGIRQIELSQPPSELADIEAPVDSIDMLVAKHVAKTLSQTHWNIKKTSEILGLSRLAVYNQIKRFKIPIPNGRNIKTAK